MKAKTSFRYSALALTFGALAHVIGHIMGPETVGFMGAPPDVVEGASQGTSLYYAMIIGIVGLLFTLAWLAWRPNKGRIARWVLWLFAAIFSLRGALFLLFIPSILKADFGPDATKFWFHFGGFSLRVKYWAHA